MTFTEGRKIKCTYEEKFNRIREGILCLLEDQWLRPGTIARELGVDQCSIECCMSTMQELLMEDDEGYITLF